MRRRFQRPKPRNRGGYWIAQYRDLAGKKCKISLGPVASVKKYDAEARLAQILEPINTGDPIRCPDFRFGPFVRQTYFPFYRRKWKDSTAASNTERVRFHLLNILENRPLISLTRNELQNLLDDKAKSGLSHSVVAHLRWDLRQIGRMAVNEGYIRQNPAELLFVPKEAPRPDNRHMTFDDVKLFFSVLEPRERIIGGLAILAGMRPGEILALRRSTLDRKCAEITQRIYRGQTDTPKTFNSRRRAAIGDGLFETLRQWMEIQPTVEDDPWVFPSEKGVTPLSRDNCWRRHFFPKLKSVGLEWANFQVMRRTHSCLLDELGVDPQVRADQMGHSVDVNQNRYTRSSMERRQNAVNLLEKTVGI